MKIYKGRRDAGGCVVTVDGRPLDPRNDLGPLSTTGFEWGYNGGGPNQLALAILADHFGDGARALNQYRSFCSSVIAMIRDDQWMLDSDRIDSTMDGVVEVPMTLEELLDKVRGKR